MDSSLTAPNEREYNGIKHTGKYYHGLAIVLSLGFFLIFSAFNCAQSLVGSIPAPPGLAPFQFMALYMTFALVCIPAPKLVSRFGPKLSMVLGALPYTGLVLTFLAPGACTGEAHEPSPCWPVEAVWALKCGMGVLVGAGAALLWTGQGTYLAQLASHAVAADPLVNAGPDGGLDPLLDGALSKADLLGASNKRFNGIFFSAFQFSGAAGLSGASVVLALVQTSDATTYLFLGLSVVCGLGLLILIFGVPNLPQSGGLDADTGGGATGPEVSLIATLRLCADPRMCAEAPCSYGLTATCCRRLLTLAPTGGRYLIAPNIMYNGASLAFIWYVQLHLAGYLLTGV